MKATGMVRPVDNLGRVVIPREIRKQFNIEIGGHDIKENCQQKPPDAKTMALNLQ